MKKLSIIEMGNKYISEINDVTGNNFDLLTEEKRTVSTLFKAAYLDSLSQFIKVNEIPNNGRFVVFKYTQNGWEVDYEYSDQTIGFAPEDYIMD